MIDSDKWFWLGGGVVAAVLVYLLAPILTPFMSAAILAYIADPVVERLVRWRVSRTVVVILVFIAFGAVFVAAIMLLLPMLQRQLLLVFKVLPHYIDVVQQQFVPWAQQKLGIDMSFDTEQLKSTLTAHWQEAGGAAGSIVKYITRSTVTLFSWLATLLLIPVVTFYLLRDWNVFITRIHTLLPRRIEPVVVRLTKASDQVLGAFLRGQLLVMLALVLFYSVGLSIVGLDLALFVAVVAGMLSFVPYLGLIIGLLLACLAAAMQFHDATHIIYVAIVFGIAQLFEGMVLTPLLIGDRIGLHPLAVIFAVLAGGQLFGFLGVLLALPTAAVIAVVIRYMHEHYLTSRLYSHP
ncbi:MAG: AI-2E family transporter [Gammaproteobacteria bacterium]|nr:AI-2E family transporter [Gammaproteobacteria bacterium]